MQIKEFDIILDIKKYKKIEEFEVVQGDIDTNVLNITLYDGLNLYSLENLDIEIAFAKSDGTTVLQSSQDEENPIIIEGDKIICTLKTNTIASPGKVLAEIRILEDTRLLTSARFEFFVRKSLINDETIESTNELPLLNKKIKEVNDLIEEVQSMEAIKGDKGDSAYQVWLDEGNTGTVEEYLNSLKGDTGEGLEFHWDGTRLGVRVEGQTDYAYIDLKGDIGEGLDFNWRGTELGVKTKTQLEFIYVDLKGETGDIENLNSQHIIGALEYTPIRSINEQTGKDIIIETGSDIEIVNNLAETETGKVLDATQGKILDDKIGILNNDLVAHKEEVNVHGNDGNILYFGDRTQVRKPLEEISTRIIYSSQQEFDDYINTVSNNMPIDTYYKRVVACTDTNAIPNLGGALSLLEGHRANKDFQWQKLTTYGQGFIFYRRCFSGVWSDWYPILNILDIVDDLTTTSTNKVLSAKQGKNLQDRKLNKNGDTLGNYSETLLSLGGTSTVINLSWEGNVFQHTLSGNTTYSITGVSSGAKSFTLIITQGTTVRTVTFPSSIKWRDGQIPNLNTASKTYILTFITLNQGSTWYGMFGGEF